MAAVRNAGFDWPRRRVTVNLAPADIRKEGSSFDLPIAIGILTASGQIRTNRLHDFVLLGELSLTGAVRSVSGLLSVATSMRQRGIYGMIVPSANAREGALAEGLVIYGVNSLHETVEILEGGVRLQPHDLDSAALRPKGSTHGVDMRDVAGQECAKRALEVAAAGSHNLLMIGPPGSGKTMLARRMSSILPDMTLDESLETTKIHSVAGQLSPGEALVTDRPFRAPHHTISPAALIGGGLYPRPGEASLAHHGVLFLDELPEFRTEAIEALRQPLESTRVTVARALLSVTYPARFVLVASMNPCPCGHLTDPVRVCVCSTPMVDRYRSRISGPLLDRIDLHIEVPPVTYEELAGPGGGCSSAEIRMRVNDCRERQLHRFRQEPGLFANAQMSPGQVRKCCQLEESAAALLKEAVKRLALSGRAYHRILKVARTIADLEPSESIREHHVAEAVQYRGMDRLP